ncbi:MAG: hypothetical protein WCC25_19200, partial [Candidatus Korobacteraceae bacterium]
LYRLLKKSLVGCFARAQLQLRRFKSLVFVITRRPSGRRGICFSPFSAASFAMPAAGKSVFEWFVTGHDFSRADQR